MFFSAETNFVPSNHRGRVDTTERWRQSRECAFEEQTKSRAAFRRYRVDKVLVKAFNHHVDRDVTAPAGKSLPQKSRRLRRQRKSRRRRSD